MRTPNRILAVLSIASLLCACSTEDGEVRAAVPNAVADVTADGPDASEDAEQDAVDSGTDMLPDVPEPGPNTLSHSFGTQVLAPFEETQPCVAWNVNNEQPLYVNEVLLVSDGSFHHSNWFIVPEEQFPGEDGFFNCGERGFSELEAAVFGTVLFAQSTQSLVEQQSFREGAVVKIPPNHTIIAAAHLLNLSDREVETELRMQLGLTHPRDVEAILAPIRFTFTALDIPPESEARFTSDCYLRSGPSGIKIHWVLPHYHYLGNHFSLDVLGGPNDGENIYRLDGFNADANGQSYDPPIDLSEADGLSFTCGYFNPRDVSVGWGIGDQEMCVMLALVESEFMFDGVATSVDETAEVGGIIMNAGDCTVSAFPQNPNQGLPTQEEVDGELYIPEGDGEIDVVERECEDTPADSVAAGPATLEGLRDGIFNGGCSFSSCHGGPNGAAGLDLTAIDLHSELMNHEVSRPDADPFIVPGDPDGSYLYQVMSQCSPTAGGAAVPHMPLNAPELLPPDQVARIRDWIAEGAQAP